MAGSKRHSQASSSSSRRASSRARNAGTMHVYQENNSKGTAEPISNVYSRYNRFSSKLFHSQPRATKLIYAFMIIFASAILFRLFYLQIYMAGEYSEMAESERTANIVMQARRGTIYDCNGNILAISVPAANLYCNPQKVTDAASEARRLAEALGDSSLYDSLKEILSTKTTYNETTNKSTAIQFAYLQKYIDVELADKIIDLNLDGIGYLETYRREYPYGAHGGQVIGACSEDENEVLHGTSGLEKYYDDILSGTAGHYILERSRTGDEIPGGVTLKEATEDGQSIMISLDIELQMQVEEKLLEANSKYESQSTSAIILDSETGQIRVAASLPLFNPADRSVVEEGATEIQGFTRPFEPGSVFKTVAAMSLLEADVTTPDTEYYCAAVLEFPNLDGTTYYISDAHDRDDEIMSLRDIIDRSSNVGIGTAIVESYGDERTGFKAFNDAIIRYGLNDYTGVDYDESVGYMLDFDQWSSHQSYCMAFGQGISVTQLQMARFYAMIENGGYNVTPHFLVKNLTTQEEYQPEKVQVITNETALAEMVDILETVVSSGTGKYAAIEGYTIAGKTSTAEVADEENGGYLNEVYNLAFISFLPNSNSDLVFYVGCSEIPYEGSVTLLSRDIMQYAIDKYRITE